MSVYLDYNASAPILPEVLDVMIDTYKNTPGNADSRTHIFGTNAQKIVQKSRNLISDIIGVDQSEVIFTSGSTESNNTVILGIEEYAELTGKKHIITTAIEHKAILEPLKYLETKGFKVDYVKPNETGRIDANHLLSLVTDKTCLVSVMYVNSETGIIQPVDIIGSALKESSVIFHIDATQALGKLNHEIRRLDYNLMSIASHKIGGPQGIGALIFKRNKDYSRPPIKQLMYGGSQERGYRPGTTPIALVAGFAKAIEICENNLEINTKNCFKIKNSFLKAIEGIEYDINGDQKYCIPSTINISIHGLDAEAAFLCLGDNYSFSNGSACNSSSHSLSYVLDAMGLNETRKSEAIRLSWSGNTNVDFSFFVSTIKSII
ncbi:MAG: aminotransferase class V-fold PLP-dependent enzyme [Lachnospiraceae bacterium]|nr:aminotransferase class V-fold PLP-dependent enzyme [Lachnospiraceae bacterium]